VSDRRDPNPPVLRFWILAALVGAFVLVAAGIVFTADLRSAIILLLIVAAIVCLGVAIVVWGRGRVLSSRPPTSRRIRTLLDVMFEFEHRVGPSPRRSTPAVTNASAGPPVDHDFVFESVVPDPDGDLLELPDLGTLVAPSAPPPAMDDAPFVIAPGAAVAGPEAQETAIAGPTPAPVTN